MSAPRTMLDVIEDIRALFLDERRTKEDVRDAVKILLGGVAGCALVAGLSITDVAELFDLAAATVCGRPDTRAGSRGEQ
jgi:hypothetical protein